MCLVYCTTIVTFGPINWNYKFTWLINHIHHVDGLVKCGKLKWSSCWKTTWVLKNKWLEFWGGVRRRVLKVSSNFRWLFECSACCSQELSHMPLEKKEFQSFQVKRLLMGVKKVENVRWFGPTMKNTKLIFCLKVQ